MVTPAGRPVAAHVYGAVPPEAVTVSDAAVPTVRVRLPGLATTGAGPLLHVNDAVAMRAAASVTVTVEVDEPAAVGVPDTTPVVASMVRPAGRPVAAHV